MERLCFLFEDLHPDAPDLPSDLDWLLRFVAGTFEVRVAGEPLFAEVEFPVLDLARVLDGWVESGLAKGRDLDYEPPGGSPGTLTIRRRPTGWQIDSVHRSPDNPLPPPLTDDGVGSGVRSFFDGLAQGIMRDYNYDVRGLLKRVQASAPR